MYALILLTVALLGPTEYSADVLRFRADLAEIASELRPELEQMHRYLTDKIPKTDEISNEGRRKLQRITFGVVAEDDHLCLDAFNAYTDGTKIVVSAGLWRRLALLAFCHASKIRDNSNYFEQFMYDVFHNRSGRGREYWRAYGRTFGDVSEDRALADQTLAILEGYLMVVIAHEQAHVYLEHRARGLLSSRQNELEADEWALRVLVQLDPSGERAALMAFFHFYVLAGLMQMDQDIAEDYIRKSTHPHPLTRAKQVCRYIRSNQKGSNSRANARVLAGIASIEEAIRLYMASDFVQP